MLSIGLDAENIAKKFLESKGYKHIESNFRTKYGEIDLIFTFDNELIFVEVKARSRTDYGAPEEFVTRSKREKLLKTANAYMQAHKKLPKSARFEIVALELNHKPVKVRHLKGLFF